MTMGLIGAIIWVKIQMTNRFDHAGGFDGQRRAICVVDVLNLGFNVTLKFFQNIFLLICHKVKSVS